MALGDNIPGIFADLPTSVMKVGMQTGGNPLAIAQYVLDLFEGKDADTELSLTQEGMLDGPPMPTDGPLVDQLVLETGDPDMAIGMVIDNAMAPSMDAPDLDAVMADTAALRLANMTPMFNDIDPARIGQISGDLGITDDALASALQSLSTQDMFADPALMGTGEDVFNPLPQLPPTPVLPPPTPEIRTAGPGSLGGIGGMIGDIGGAIAGLPGAIGGLGRNIGEFLGSPYAEGYPVGPPPELGVPWVGTPPGYNVYPGVEDRDRQDRNVLPIEPPPPTPTGPPPPMGPPGGEPPPTPPGPKSPFDLKLDAIKLASTQNKLLPSQLETALEDLIVSDMDQNFQREFKAERGGGLAKAHVKQAVQDVILEWGEQATADEFFEGTQALGNLQVPFEPSPPVLRPPADDPAGFPVPGLMGEGPLLPGQKYGLPPEAAATEFETLGTAGIYSESPGRAQWNAWLPSVLGTYGAPNVKKAYDTTFAPFYGTYLLSDEAQNVPVQAGFPDFMDKHQPQKFPVLAWSKRQGEWNRLVANSQAKVVGDNATLNSTDRNVLGGEANMKQNLTMWQVVNGSDKALRKQYAISTALARYYKGRPVSGNYATRAVESSFTDIYDRIVTRTMTQGGDAFSIFISTLASQNPERFGVTGG